LKTIEQSIADWRRQMLAAGIGGIGMPLREDVEQQNRSIALSIINYTAK